MKRFNLNISNTTTGTYIHGMMEDEDGQFVKFDDAQERIAQLEQEIEIANEGLTVVYMSGTSEVKEELNALKAHCEEMRQHIRYGYEPAKDDESIEAYSKKSVAILDKTPAQSLAEIQAQAIEEMTKQVTAFIAETGEYSTEWVISKDDVIDHIQRLREGAK